MCDLGLLLKYRAHQLGQTGIDLDDLLKLVEHERDAPLTLDGEASGKREQPFEGGVDVLSARARVEAEGDRAVLGIDPHHWGDAQAGEHPQALACAKQARGDLLVDRSGELLGKLLLCRRPHQIDLRDEHVLGHELLGDPPDQR